MAELTFDDKSHEYKSGGIRVPSVTQIMEAVGMYRGLENIPKFVLKKAAERGHAVHSMIEYHAQGDLDESTIDPDLAGYFNAYLLCRKEHPEIFDNLTHFEKKVHCEKFCYCGRYDAGGERIVIDYKTTAQTSHLTGLQLSAYWFAEHLDYMNDKPDILAGIYLRKDGTYKLVKYPYQPLQWMACVTIHGWQVTHGII